MSVFITSTTVALRHGVYGIERRVPKVVAAIGTGVAACVGQFPWGPVGELVTPDSPGDLVKMFMPYGSDRVSSSGCAVVSEKAFPVLKIVRVLGADAEKASVAIPEEGSGSPAEILGVEAKYKGTLGNSLTATVSDASNGDADAFNLTLTLSGANGTTEELFEDLDLSEPDAELPSVEGAALVGALTQLGAGRPVNGDHLLTGGTDGSVVAADYVGTPNASDKGLALLETDKSIRHVFTDDPGDALRAAVNSGLQAHAVLMGDREAYVVGDKGLTAAEVQADKLNYTSDRVLYCDGWVKQFVDGQLVDAPSAPFAACVASQIPPSLDIAWKGGPIGEMLIGIKGLVTPRGAGIIPTLQEKGINVLVREEDGSYRWNSSNVASYPTAKETGLLTRRRMTDFVVISAAQTLRSYVDAPNIEEIQDEEQLLLGNFLAGLKANKKTDPFGLPFIVDYELEDLAAANPAGETEQGKFYLPFKVKTAASQSWIFLLATIGPTVVITQQNA